MKFENSGAKGDVKMTCGSIALFLHSPNPTNQRLGKLVESRHTGRTLAARLFEKRIVNCLLQELDQPRRPLLGGLINLYASDEPKNVVAS